MTKREKELLKEGFAKLQAVREYTEWTLIAIEGVIHDMAFRDLFWEHCDRKDLDSADRLLRQILANIDILSSYVAAALILPPSDEKVQRWIEARKTIFPSDEYPYEKNE